MLMPDSAETFQLCYREILLNRVNWVRLAQQTRSVVAGLGAFLDAL
jgi:hypothetical protein